MKNKLILLLLFPFMLNAQIRISDVYLNGGYQFSNTEIPTSFINEFKGNEYGKYIFPQDSMPNFDNIQGFSNIGLGAIVSFKNLPILSFDLSADYLFHEKQRYDYHTFSVFNGYETDSLDLTGSGQNKAQFASKAQDMYDVRYEYGFEINNVVLGFAPQAQFDVTSKLYFSIGFGALANFISIKQQGYQMQISKEQWTTSAYSHSANYMAWALQGKAVMGLKLTKHHNIDIGARYVSTTINEIEPLNEFLWVDSIEGSNAYIIPMYKSTIDFKSNKYHMLTKLDLSGVNVFLRYRYTFGGE